MRTRKIGGIRFIWIGRLTVSYSWSTKKHPTTKKHRPTKTYPIPYTEHTWEWHHNQCTKAIKELTNA